MYYHNQLICHTNAETIHAADKLYTVQVIKLKVMMDQPFK